jgi:hypothetical protein
MSPTLPRHPNLDHLRKTAKRLLTAHKDGRPGCCQFLRQLQRFADASDEEILDSKLTLADAQQVVAMLYGFSGWPALKEEVQSRPADGVHSLEAVMGRCKKEIPDYAGAGVPLAVTAALNYGGVDIDFMDFAAASGWAFSFGYRYDDISPAYMAVRGKPGADGSLEVFSFLPLQYGFDYEIALTSEPEALWSFVVKQVDAGTPVMSEHMDGGLITAYRERDGRRQIFFDGSAFPGWKEIDGLQPYAVYSLVKKGHAQPPESIRSRALQRAVEKGRAAVAPLQSYLSDVRDEMKDFAKCEEWFCWAAFERLIARRCCEVWLRRTAKQLEGKAAKLVAAAAERYGEAHVFYGRYCDEVHGREITPESPRERARRPERIAVIAPLLEKGIAAEVAGLELLEQVTIGWNEPTG